MGMVGWHVRILVFFKCCFFSDMKFVLLILLSYFVVSCGGYGVSPVAAPMVSYSQALGRDGSIRKAKSVQRKLIKNGLITLECVDVKNREGAVSCTSGVRFSRVSDEGNEEEYCVFFVVDFD